MDNKPLVLIVDDDRLNLIYLKDSINSFGYNTQTASCGKEALEMVREIAPDIILLDIIMPEIDGYEVCRILQEYDDTADIPVLFITALSRTSQIVKGFDVGGVDYVTKPFRPEELKSRINTHIELRKSKNELMAKNRQLLDAYLEIEKKNDELNIIMEQLELSSITDPLTKLKNRRFMMDILEKEYARSIRGNLGFCAVLCDIDYFKNVNDRFGHNFGDFVLERIAEIISAQVRINDTVCRWGGEEFLILLPETEWDEGVVVAERIRVCLENELLANDGMEHRVTMTFGISESFDAREINEIVKRADVALYEGKKSGRNRVVVWNPIIGAVNEKKSQN